MAVLTSLDNALKWLQLAIQELQAEASPPQAGQESASSQAPQIQTDVKISWGAKVSPEFKKRVLWIADTLGCDPSWLMACMAWESGESFSPSKRNMAGSGATGLIQFMPTTAAAMGTTVNVLAALSAEDQLRYVYEYFKPLTGRLHNLGDIYMTILWPRGVGQPDSFILFDRAKTPTTFRQNSGLDLNHNGSVTRGECLVKIKEKLAKGLGPGYIG